MTEVVQCSWRKPRGDVETQGSCLGSCEETEGA